MGSIVVINTPLSKLKDILLTYIEETNRERDTHTVSIHIYIHSHAKKMGKKRRG